MHNSLTCAACGLAHDADRLQNLCNECGKPLLVGYDLSAIKDSFTPDAVRSRAVHSMWRFHEVLPVDDPADAVTLGEGSTPLLKCRRREPGFRAVQLRPELHPPRMGKDAISAVGQRRTQRR